MSLILSRRDPRDPSRPLGRGELNCDRYTTIDGRIFRVYRSSGSWHVEELETETSMVTFDECVAVCLRNLAEVREAILGYIVKWPTESRAAHEQRLREWVKSLKPEIVR